MSSYTITIPDVPPSLNKVLRMHWATKRKLRNDWILLLRCSWPAGGLCDGKRRVKVVLWHSRFYDKDNAYGACKVLFDVLRHEGFIVNDSPDWLEQSVTQEKCPHKKRHTVIEIGASTKET